MPYWDRNTEKLTKPYTAEKQDPHCDAVVAKVIWIDGLPSLMVSDCPTFGAKLHCRHRQKLVQLLTEYIGDLQQGGDYYSLFLAFRNFRGAVINMIYNESPPKPQHTWSLAFAITYHDAQDKQTKVASLEIGYGTELIAIYRNTTNCYETVKPAARNKNSDTYITSIRPIASGDQILALTAGAYADLHLVEQPATNDPGTVRISINPNVQFLSSQQLLSELLSDDIPRAALASASIPSHMDHQQILDSSLGAIKALIRTELNIIYPQRNRFFYRRHHNERREAVLNAIDSAATVDQVLAILDNQRGLCTHVNFTAVSEELLASRWSQSSNVRNAFSAKSLYRSAIESAYNMVHEEILPRSSEPSGCTSSLFC